MSEPISLHDLKRELAGTEQRIEQRFDRFEAHFDDTMTAIRATLDEIHDQVGQERRREVARLEDAVLALAMRTGHLDEVTALLHANVRP